MNDRYASPCERSTSSLGDYTTKIRKILLKYFSNTLSQLNWPSFWNARHPIKNTSQYLRCFVGNYTTKIKPEICTLVSSSVMRVGSDTFGNPIFQNTKLAIFRDYKRPGMLCLALPAQRKVQKLDFQSEFSMSKIIRIFLNFFFHRRIIG